MTLRKLLLVSIAALGLVSASAPAFAASQTLCSPDPSGAAAGPRRVTNTSSTASPQPSYQLNSAGCGLVASADIGFFLSQGFTIGAEFSKVIFTTGVQTSTTDLIVGSVPAGYYIREMFWQNLTANAVTGGIDVGTTANGVDVVSAQAVGASALTFTADAALLKRVFSTTVATPIHISGHTAWNSANVTLTMVMAPF